MVYGGLSVFGNPAHEKVQDYSGASPAVRLQYCRVEFWDDHQATPSRPRAMTLTPSFQRHERVEPGPPRPSTVGAASRTLRGDPSTLPPSPSERQAKKRRLDEPSGSFARSDTTFSAPRGLLGDAKKFFSKTDSPLSNAEYRRQSYEAYKNFFIRYAGYATSYAPSLDEAREMAFTVVTEQLLDQLHRINNVHGGSFTDIFGVAANKRRP